MVKFSKIPLIIFVIFLSKLSFSRDFEFGNYNDVGTCSEFQYFDHVTLKCLPCPANQTSHGNPYSCSCGPGFKRVYEEGSISFECKSCPPLHAVSEDGRSCLPCYNSTLFNSTSHECTEECTSNAEFLIDRHINGSLLSSKQCLHCSSGSIPGRRMCVACHKSFYIASGGDSCTCPSKTHVLLGGICTSQSELVHVPDKVSSYTVTFDNGEEVQSLFFEENYRIAAHSCRFSANSSSCQLLSNMCVLLHFDFEEDFSACRYYRREFGENYINLPEHVPWLYYPEGDAEVYLSKTKIKTYFSFKEDNVNSRLNISVAKYSAEGEFMEYGRLEDVLTLCPLIDFYLSDAMKFGTTFSKSCTISARDIWDKYQTEFYDLFLQYYDEEELMSYALPILNMNYKEGGSYRNREARKKWQLTRRFFLFDNISGRESLSPNTADNEDRARVVRYPMSLEIVIKLREGEGPGLIYPPLIKIAYGEISDKDYNSNRKVEMSFRVLYTMDFTKIHEDISVAVGVMSAFAALWSLIGTWSWSRRCGKMGIDPPIIVHLILNTCGNLANVFFAVMYFACFYWTVFFKRQDVVHLFLLTQKQELIIKQYLIAACFLKLIQVIHIVYTQVTVDMFIIDWEQPRATNSLPHPQLSTSQDEEKPRSEQPISIWRTYFIANEWNELQTHRRINVGFQMFLTLLFLKVIGFENLATADPRSKFSFSDTSYVPPQSYVCRFAISITIYIVIAVVQWLFRTSFYERCIENKLQQFIDLCSIANVSVFILEHSMYGYYIHGRSVHGYADVDMQSFYEQLKREEEDLCGHRGLEPSSECQTFEVSITYKFREQYDTILQPVHNFTGMRKPGSRGRMASAEMEQSFQAHETMKRFFGMFLQHALSKDLDYVVKEKLFLESILDVEFQEADDRCLFFRDGNHVFDRVLICGREGFFVLSEMLLFTFVDLVSMDFVLAAIVTCIVAYMIKRVRYAGGRRNVVHKTLVDQRFLI